MHAGLRLCARLSLKSKLKKPLGKQTSVHPTTPARTRFAPSPTGFLHLGSLRTALYNYLLAKSTNGQFLLRLEDTDQTRLVPGAEQDIYSSLKWCGLEPDESPLKGGPFGPYRQTDRMDIYKKYADLLISQGLAYKCYCSRERLVSLRELAMQLKPPTTVTYDRKCLTEQKDQQDKQEQNGYTVRFRAPDVYEPFSDLLHGSLNLQPQYNDADRRYDDFVILKLDGLPTYHFANVVDDHLMQITHVVRGEEWLTLTPKHVALYRAFGWLPPKFIHIPLLTSLEDKKLSKRQGDIGISLMKEQGILPEALTNFCALFGWAPPRGQKEKTSEVMTLEQLVALFLLDHLTKGNAKVNDNKLWFFNKHHLAAKIADPEKLAQLVEDYYPRFQKFAGDQYSKEFLSRALTAVGPSITTIYDFENVHSYLVQDVKYEQPKDEQTKKILGSLRKHATEEVPMPLDAVLADIPSASKRQIFEAARYALSGGVPGLTIPVLISIIGTEKYFQRLDSALAFLH